MSDASQSTIRLTPAELAKMLVAPVPPAAIEAVRRGVKMARELQRTGKVIVHVNQ
jgi:hypothetical protein